MTPVKMANKKLQKALEVMDIGPSELARKLGITPAYITKMGKTRLTPALHCRDIERLTKGAVTAEELNPVVFSPSYKD